MINKRTEKIFLGLIRFLSLISVLGLVFVIVFILKEGIVIFSEISVKEFILGSEWRPTSANARFGLLPMVLGTLAVTGLALVIALPLAVGVSVFFISSKKCTTINWLKQSINLMAGIPSVVYGFIGVMVLIPFIESFFNRNVGESILAGGILLSVMILPFMVSTIAESMEVLKQENHSTSRAMGVSEFYMIRKLILPASKKGVLVGTILGISRAVGETMAVMMVVGNSPLMPESIFQRVKPLTSLIALEIGSASHGSLHYHALFGASLLLLIILLCLNILVRLIAGRRL